jgi:chromosome segregation ATPase
LELERGDRLQRIVDLEAEVTTLQEDVDAGDIERLTLLQNITEMQQQVEEAEVHIVALQGTYSSSAGHRGFTATTSSAGTSRGAVGTVCP